VTLGTGKLSRYKSRLPRVNVNPHQNTFVRRSMSQPSAAALSAIVDGGNGILQTKYMYFAAFAISIYDHILTLDIEVEHIWKRKYSVVTGLFFLTRYLFLVIQFADLFLIFAPVVDISICHRYLWFILGLATTPLTGLPNCIVTMRVYALYERNTILAVVLLLYILAQAVVSLRIDFLYPVTPVNAFARIGFPQLDNVPAIRFCAPILSTKLNWFEESLTQIMQSAFDTTALVLILVKARKRSNSGLITLIAKQGLVYYILNSATYITWALMLIFAPPGNRLLMSGPSIAFGCLSVNRLTLHLRSYSSVSDPGDPDRVITPFIAKRQRRNSWLGTSTLEMPDGGGRNIYIQ